MGYRRGRDLTRRARGRTAPRAFGGAKAARERMSTTSETHTVRSSPKRRDCAPVETSTSGRRVFVHGRPRSARCTGTSGALCATVVEGASCTRVAFRTSIRCRTMQASSTSSGAKASYRSSPIPGGVPHRTGQPRRTGVPLGRGRRLERVCSDHDALVRMGLADRFPSGKAVSKSSTRCCNLNSTPISMMTAGARIGRFHRAVPC